MIKLTIDDRKNDNYTIDPACAELSGLSSCTFTATLNISSVDDVARAIEGQRNVFFVNTPYSQHELHTVFYLSARAPTATLGDGRASVRSSLTPLLNAASQQHDHWSSTSEVHVAEGGSEDAAGGNSAGARSDTASPHAQRASSSRTRSLRSEAEADDTADPSSGSRSEQREERRAGAGGEQRSPRNSLESLDQSQLLDALQTAESLAAMFAVCAKELEEEVLQAQPDVDKLVELVAGRERLENERRSLQILHVLHAKDAQIEQLEKTRAKQDNELERAVNERRRAEELRRRAETSLMNAESTMDKMQERFKATERQTAGSLQEQYKMELKEKQSEIDRLKQALSVMPTGKGSDQELSLDASVVEELMGELRELELREQKHAVRAASLQDQVLQLEGSLGETSAISEERASQERAMRRELGTALANHAETADRLQRAQAELAACVEEVEMLRATVANAEQNHAALADLRRELNAVKGAHGSRDRAMASLEERNDKLHSELESVQGKLERARSDLATAMREMAQTRVNAKKAADARATSDAALEEIQRFLAERSAMSKSASSDPALSPALLSKRFVEAKLAEANALRRLKAASRVEAELRSQLSDLLNSKPGKSSGPRQRRRNVRSPNVLHGSMMDVDERRLAQLEVENNDLRRELAEMSIQSTAEDPNLKTLVESLRRGESREKELAHDLTTTSKNLEAAMEREHALSKDVEAAMERERALSKDLEAAMEREHALSKDLEAARERERALSKDVEAATEELKAEKRALDVLKMEHITQMGKLQTELESTGAAREEALKAQQAADDEAREARAQLVTTSEDLRVATTEVEDTMRELEGIVAQLHEEQRLREELEAAQANSCLRIKDLENMLHSSEEELEAQRGDIQETQLELNSVRDEANKMALTCKALEADLAVASAVRDKQLEADAEGTRLERLMAEDLLKCKVEEERLRSIVLDLQSLPDEVARLEALVDDLQNAAEVERDTVATQTTQDAQHMVATALRSKRLEGKVTDLTAEVERLSAELTNGEAHGCTTTDIALSPMPAKSHECHRCSLLQSDVESLIVSMKGKDAELERLGSENDALRGSQALADSARAQEQQGRHEAEEELARFQASARDKTETLEIALQEERARAAAAQRNQSASAKERLAKETAIANLEASLARAVKEKDDADERVGALAASFAEYRAAHRRVVNYDEELQSAPSSEEFSSFIQTPRERNLVCTRCALSEEWLSVPRDLAAGISLMEAEIARQAMRAEEAIAACEVLDRNRASEIRALRDKLAEHSTWSSNLDQRSVSSEALDVVLTKVAQLEREMQMSNQTRETDSFIERLRSEIEELKAANLQLTGDLRIAHNDAEFARDEAASAMADLNAELRRKSRALKDLRSVAREQRERIKLGDVAVSESAAERTEVLVARRRDVGAMKDLRARVDAAQGRAKKAEQALIERDDTIARNEEQIKRLRGDCNRKQSIIATLKQKLADVESEKENVISATDTPQSTSHLSGARKRYDKSIRQLKEEVREHEEWIRAMKEAVKSFAKYVVARARSATKTLQFLTGDSSADSMAMSVLQLSISELTDSEGGPPRISVKTVASSLDGRSEHASELDGGLRSLVNSLLDVEVHVATLKATACDDDGAMVRSADVEVEVALRLEEERSAFQAKIAEYEVSVARLQSQLFDNLVRRDGTATSAQ